jgi:hypothetical protein
MLPPRSDRIRKFASRAAIGAVLFVGWIDTGFAQEPPLDIPPAGALAGLTSSGCDAGLVAATNPYANITPTNTGAGTAVSTGAHSTAAANSGSDLNFPINGNPFAGDNVPLYSPPNPGMNAPLYSGTTSTTSSGLYGNFNPREENAVANVGPLKCRSGIPLGEWLIYPSIRLDSLYSDNLFLSPNAPLNAFGFGVSPAVTAQWTNGIHTTTIFADVDTQQYPTDNPINTFDREATFTQQYSPLPDLTFTGSGDYTHKTVATSLTSSIPTTISTPVTTPTLLPDGNIELPNGTIISPTGQVVGNIKGPSGANGTSIVNPYDQYTGTATASKIFNHGIVTVGGSWAQTDYQFLQSPGTTSAFSSFATQTYREDASFWLGPVFYAYSDGAFSMRTNGEGLDPYSQSYRVTGGIGTRQFGLFRGSVYLGYQGSNADSSGSAGGTLYGAKLSYYPTLDWVIDAAIDETINKASGGPTTLALAIDSPVQIPLSSSTRITHPSLQATYALAAKWTALGNFSYTQIDYYGSPRVDNAWQFDAQLSYDMWRNMTLTWEYEYTDVVSNAPGNSATRNLLMMSALYHF